MEKTARSCLRWVACVVLTSCWCLKCGGQGADERDPPYRVQAVVVAAIESGIDIAWPSSTETESGQPSNHLMLVNQYFGQECGTDRCNLVIVGPYMLLSVANRVLFMRFETSNGTFQDNPAYHIFGQPETQLLSCQPTTIFIPYPNFHFVACVNVTAQIIHFVNFNLNLVDLAESSLDSRAFKSESLADTSLTNFVYDADAQCIVADPDNYILVADSHTVKVYSTQDHRVFKLDDHLISEQCSHPESLEYYDDDTVLVRCPDNIAERLEVCIQNTIQLFTPNITGVPYPCGTWDKVAYLKSNGVLIESQDPPVWIDLNLAGVEHAQCVSANKREYVVLLQDDRVVVVETGSKVIFHTLANRSCISPPHCFKPQTWENRFIGYTNGSHFLVKDLFCLMNPEIIVLDSDPRVVELLINEIPSSVECTVQPTATSLTNGVTTSFKVPTTILQTPLASPKPPVVGPPVDEESDTATDTQIVVIIAVVVGVVVFVLIAIFSLGVAFWYRNSRKGRSRRCVRTICISPSVSTQTLPVSAFRSPLQNDDQDQRDRSTIRSVVNGDSNLNTPETTPPPPVMESQQVQQPLSLRHGPQPFITHLDSSQMPSEKSDYPTSSSASPQEPFISNSDHLTCEEPRLKPLSDAFPAVPAFPLGASVIPSQEAQNQQSDLPCTTSTVVGGLTYIPYRNIHPETVALAHSEDRVNDLQLKARQAAP